MASDEPRFDVFGDQVYFRGVLVANLVDLGVGTWRCEVVDALHVRLDELESHHAFFLDEEDAYVEGYREAVREMRQDAETRMQMAEEKMNSARLVR